MTSLVFVIPAHGRLEKTRVCLRQLARTCHALEGDGFHATAVVIADDENLDTADDLGFITVPHANYPLGRKWNAGYRRAASLAPDFVIPFGSDDWIDPILFLEELPTNAIRCSHLSSVVREDGLAITQLSVVYQRGHDYGDGVRILPASLMRRVRWQPVEDNRERAIDTSIIRKLTQTCGRPKAVFSDVHPYQIVDWKTPEHQLNTYRECCNFRASQQLDPWTELAGRYPGEALDEMRSVYGLPVEALA